MDLLTGLVLIYIIIKVFDGMELFSNPIMGIGLTFYVIYQFCNYGFWSGLLALLGLAFWYLIIMFVRNT